MPHILADIKRLDAISEGLRFEDFASDLSEQSDGTILS